MNTQQFLLFTDIAFRVIGILAIITGALAVLNRFYVTNRQAKKRRKARMRDRILLLEDRLDLLDERIAETHSLIDRVHNRLSQVERIRDIEQSSIVDSRPRKKRPTDRG